MGKGERRGDAAGSVFGSLEFNCVKSVFGDKIKDGLDKLGAALRGDRPRKITGTRPSADGDASLRTM